MSELKVNSIVDANSGNTAQINGMTPTADSLQGFRNRIINGDMRIDQRNAGAAVTPTDAYTLDRWLVREDTDGAISFQQVTDAPTGFSFSGKITATAADASLTGTQRLLFGQTIEGFNTADFMFGSANAQTITLSFWVKSSLTGTFAGAVQNSGRTRSYVFNYTINAANTWEQKSVTIAGDTSGTWVGATNGVGLHLIFSLGIGPDYTGTANSWQGSQLFASSGAVSVVGTLNATWQITGVQLEAGSVATPFERRPYGTELALCQRYYYRIKAGAVGDNFNVGYCDSTTVAPLMLSFPVSMRTPPTALEQSGTAGDYTVVHAGVNTTCSSVPSFATATTDNSRVNFTVASGFTAGRGAIGRAANTSAYLAWSAEL